LILSAGNDYRTSEKYNSIDQVKPQMIEDELSSCLFILVINYVGVVFDDYSRIPKITCMR